MTENEEFDLNEVVNGVSEHLEDIIADAMQEQIEDSVTCALQDILPKVYGAIVRPRQYMKLLSLDKAKMLLCYSGLLQ